MLKQSIPKLTVMGIEEKYNPPYMFENIYGDGKRRRSKKLMRKHIRGLV